MLALDRQTGLTLMLAVDTASYAVAALLTAAATAGALRPAPATRADAAAASYRVVLRDRALLRLTLLNVVCTLMATAPLIAMPVFLIDSVRGPAWLPGFAAGLLTGTVAVAMTRSPRPLHRRLPDRLGGLRSGAPALVGVLLGTAPVLLSGSPLPSQAAA